MALQICRECRRESEPIIDFGKRVCPNCYAPASADPAPTSSGSAKPFKYRSVRYRGRKHNYGAEPWYRYRPENIIKAVEEGRLLDVDGTVAGAINDHNRRHRGEGRRISCPALAVKLNKSVPTVKRSVSRMLHAGELAVLASGRGEQRGGIYQFPPREMIRLTDHE
ncbi:MAG TPA: hypothetical protein VGU71_04150 [Candidatus Dormibacteraeota bacterium]|nr:hypothetical protein [Candidatus Dormibacteraeota bacterium]